MKEPIPPTHIQIDGTVYEFSYPPILDTRELRNDLFGVLKNFVEIQSQIDDLEHMVKKIFDSLIQLKESQPGGNLK